MNQELTMARNKYAPYRKASGKNKAICGNAISAIAIASIIRQ